MSQQAEHLDPTDSDLPAFAFDNSFARELEGFYVAQPAAKVPEPRLLLLNRGLAAELGLDADALDSDAGAQIFAGNIAPEGAAPLAQAYAGHQFGGFSPQLGDGRALLLGEIVDAHGQRRDIQLKGSGRTPFSRSGDGKAALGPVLREYLIGEAMHALGVPTTRALAAVATGEPVYRETALPGAVLTRVSASHLRVGTFQFFAARQDFDKVRQLSDYAIARHHPAARDAENPYLAFFEAVADVQAELVAQWMSIGFIHGVMNTDNMTISGETIDYGPCAFMDAYAPETVFSSIDTHGRYAYGNQPPILAWNLARLAECLIPLVDDDRDTAVEILTEAANKVAGKFQAAWLARMRAKIGLVDEVDGDEELVHDLLDAMHSGGADFTLTFRRLSAAVRGDLDPLRELFSDTAKLDAWLPRWQERIEPSGASADAPTADKMDRVNPVYIPRNHKVEEALEAAVERSDLGPVKSMLDVVTRPFEDVDGQDDYATPGPKLAAPYQTFCGT
ncbi:MAG: YdiU family protein [Alphaproteobacteria bacterium]|nr:YdiU family protein [Alphaproteobacteria bacterium]